MWMSDFRDDRSESTAYWTGYLSQSKLRLVRYRGEVKMTCATAAKRMFCFAMGVWMPSCSNLGNADLLNRAPRHLPSIIGKRWRCSPGNGRTWKAGLLAGLPNGVACR